MSNVITISFRHFSRDFEEPVRAHKTRLGPYWQQPSTPPATLSLIFEFSSLGIFIECEKGSANAEFYRGWSCVMKIVRVTATGYTEAILRRAWFKFRTWQLTIAHGSYRMHTVSDFHLRYSWYIVCIGISYWFRRHKLIYFAEFSRTFHWHLWSIMDNPRWKGIHREKKFNCTALLPQDIIKFIS